MDHVYARRPGKVPSRVCAKIDNAAAISLAGRQTRSCSGDGENKTGLSGIAGHRRGHSFARIMGRRGARVGEVRGIDQGNQTCLVLFIKIAIIPLL